MNDDFYEEIRKKEAKKMNTAEMWLKAQENGKTYQCEDLGYQKDSGFIEAHDFISRVYFESGEDLEDILALNGWKEVSNIMTKSEAEAKFNIKIVG